ncbi:MAG TPA: type II toxin-antitoxin system VapC family toxin [Acidobacteriaceae bacterium]
MTGLDTNILVRLFMDDEPAQTAKVIRLLHSLSAEEQGWISLPVVMELAWVLTKIYHVSRPELVRVLKTLLSRKELLLEQAELIHAAIHLYSKANVGFADSIIMASSQAAGCSQTFTFDQAAAKSVGMTLLS